jgi:phosphoglycerate-specific signal transduction histidine kinase
MMLADLQTVKQATASLPSNIQDGLQVLNRELGATIHDLSIVIGDQELATSDKIYKVRDTVQQRVQPLLDATTAKISEILEGLKAKKVDGKKKVRF